MKRVHPRDIHVEVPIYEGPIVTVYEVAYTPRVRWRDLIRYWLWYWFGIP